jgi:hypothetical protein
MKAKFIGKTENQNGKMVPKSRNFATLFEAIGNHGLSSSDVKTQYSNTEISKRATWSTFMLFFHETGDHFERWVDNYYTPRSKTNKDGEKFNNNEKKIEYKKSKEELRLRFSKPDGFINKSRGNRKPKSVIKTS